MSAVDRQQMAGETVFCPGLAIIDRLPAQFGQFPGAVGDNQLPGRRRQMQEGLLRWASAASRPSLSLR
jgi:hypothetical protein